jgi:hypothetical protein
MLQRTVALVSRSGLCVRPAEISLDAEARHETAGPLARHLNIEAVRDA